MNQIKNAFLRKQAEKSENRKVWLRHPDTIKSVLLVTDNESKALKRQVESLFPKASVFLLFLREIKEDTTVGFYYSVHRSDFNLTGKIKNDKLKNLLEMQPEILLDLSTDADLLPYFIQRSMARLKVGRIDHVNKDTYDLLIEFESGKEESVKTIVNRLKTLTQNEQISL